MCRPTTEIDSEARRNALLNVAFAESGQAAQAGATSCSSLVALLAKLCNVGASASGTGTGPAGKLLTAKYDAKMVPLSGAHFARVAKLSEPELAELCDSLATETRRTMFVGTSSKQPPSAKALHCVNFLISTYSSGNLERLTARIIRDGRFLAAIASELTAAVSFSNAALVDFRVRTAYLFGMLLASVTRVVAASDSLEERTALDPALTGALRAVLNALVEQLRDQTAYRNARFRLVATHCVFQLSLLLATCSATEKVRFGRLIYLQTLLLVLIKSIAWDVTS